MPAISRIRRVFLLAATAATAACGESTAPEPAPPTVASVEITTATTTLAVGHELQFAARALARDGTLVPDRAATWTSSNEGVLAVTPQGRVHGVAAGTATLRATVDGKHDDAVITVDPAPVASIELSQVAISLPEFGAQVVTATPRDAAGRPLEGRAAAWTSANTAIATVDAQGRIAAQAVGTTTVSVQFESRTATLDVTVVPAEVASVSVTPRPIVLGVFETAQLTAVVKDADGHILTGRTVTWTAYPAELVAVSAGGKVIGIGYGYAHVTATVGDKSFGVAVTVTNGEAEGMPSDLVYHRSGQGLVGHIMLQRTTGGAPQQLNAGDVSRQPTPSPDGSRIAFFVSMQELGTGAAIDDIFAVDVNGMNMKRLTSEEGYDGDPAWSPDGTRIAYRRVDPGTGRSAIWVMNADGSEKKALTADLDESHSVGTPSWSRDGARIAFGVIRNAQPTITGIWSMNADGTGKREHTSTTTGFDQGPTWSPDGLRIAFTRSYGNEVDITIVTLATGAETRLELPGQQWGPAWSPDGRHFAFWQPVGYMSRTAIYTVRVDGTNPRVQVSDVNGANVYDPEWIKR